MADLNRWPEMKMWLLLLLGLTTWVGQAVGQGPNDLADTVVNDRLDHGFGWSGRERGHSVEGASEDNGIVLALGFRADQCIAFKCSRAYTAVPGTPLTINNALLVKFENDGSMRPLPTQQGDTPLDDDLHVECPGVNARGSLVMYPMNKRDIAHAAGFPEKQIGAPIVLKVGVALKLFVFKDGTLSQFGFLVSEPFYLKITETEFEISADSPE